MRTAGQILRRTLRVLIFAGVSAAVAGCTDKAAGSRTEVVIIARLGGRGLEPGRFAFPRAIDTDDRSLWVIDKAARVQRLDPATGQVLAAWSMPESSLGKPTGVTIAIGPAGEPAVYVPDTHYHRVMVYAIPGGPDVPPTLLDSFGSYGVEPGRFIYPTDVAVLPTYDGGGVERVYVSEYGGNDRVSVFDADRRFLFSVGSPRGGASPSPDQVEFDRPQSIALDPGRRRLIVADACDHRLGVFELDGALVRWIGSRESAGTAPGSFSYPYGLALCTDGSVLVAEFGNSRVQRIDPESGRCLGVFFSVGRSDGQVMAPWGVATIGSTAYVLDSGNSRILGFLLTESRLAGARPTP